jgi:hypothetical protein
MSNPLDPTLRELRDCGCCAGTEPQTPAVIENRPGLPALAFRAGRHPQFKATMLAALSARGHVALAGLKTREDDDFSIALLDGWACVADVLTFYNERIANEAFLHTATERRSVIELAREIGYELNPGVAASTWLAFTIEKAYPPATQGDADIPERTRLQSIPGPGEKPQVYETLSAFHAHNEWNVMHPLASRRSVPFLGMTQLRLAGVVTNLKRGDALLIIGKEREEDPKNENWDFRRVQTIEEFPNAEEAKAFTLVTVDHPIGNAARKVEPAKDHAVVFALRQRANFFGFNAPQWRAMPKEIRMAFGDTDPGTFNEWPNFKLAATAKPKNTVHLDAVYSGIVAKSWLVVSKPGHQEVYRVLENIEDASADFTLTAKTSRIVIQGENLREKFNKQRREAAIFAQSEELPWADEPVHEALGGGQITLDRVVPELPAGRELLVSGLPARVRVTEEGASLVLQFDGGGHRAMSKNDLLTVLAAPEPVPTDPTHQRWLLENKREETGAVLATDLQFTSADADPEAKRVFEIVRVKRVETAADGLPQIILEEPLRHAYDPTTVEIAGNVAFSTNGETVEETLGQGDASRPHQQFTLKQKPLTFVPATTASGGETTLEVWVNDVLWHETPTLFEAGPRDRVYAARQADDGTVTLTFGDGIRGARLPTGHDNVRARYRKGIGHEGLVKERQLSLLITRPLGVKGAENPRPAEGAADPEIFADSRRNAPLTVLTLDRAVSLQDYEDFARAFGGVARAHAVWTWEVSARGVFVTVAGANGALLSDDGDTIRNLARALREHGNPLVSARVRGYRPAKFRLAATITTEVDQVPEKVLAAVKAALVARFSFAARDFAQPVARSQVIAVMQDVPGVESVNLEALHRDASGVDPYLAVATPESGASGENVDPAELLTLDESSLEDVKVRTA